MYVQKIPLLDFDDNQEEVCSSLNNSCLWERINILTGRGKQNGKCAQLCFFKILQNC